MMSVLFCVVLTFGSRVFSRRDAILEQNLLPYFHYRCVTFVKT